MASSEEENEQRPSFFELSAADQLQDLLHPVSRYIISVLAQRHPRYLLAIFNRHDEVFAFAMLVIERHFLSTWSPSLFRPYSIARLGGLSGFGRCNVCRTVLRSQTKAAPFESVSSRSRRSSGPLPVVYGTTPTRHLDVPYPQSDPDIRNC